jgi:hypothetical protein
MSDIVHDNPNAEFVNDDPPIIRFNDFMTEEECDMVQQLGGPGLEASTGTGALVNGVFERTLTSGRTSWNSWCMGHCQNHPTMTTIDARIANVTGFSFKNMEYYQILRYEAEQVRARRS